MAFDTTTRNRLAKFVAEARRVLTEEFSEQLQSLYGISGAGGIAPLERLTHLDAEGLELAATLRQRIAYLTSSSPATGDATKPAIDRLTREQAFTVLNRLAAIRMAEKRGLIVESVGQQYQSKGFKVFESVAGSAIGDTYDRYRCYLFCLFDELAIDLGSLFDRRSPQALLFPRETSLLALLDLLDEPDLQDLWAEDETIGWIYQYYNDPAERKKMREESAAPRNSRELAVRNQFFTPRYVVEFLTDNTLGRIWYEMAQGVTTLKEQCRYLVRRPTEVFLKPGEHAPEQPTQDGLSQEDLLKQPVYIAHRPLKDPRSILMLDPACGSMHFGLYAFDLFEAIYDEAWDIATGSDDAAKSGEAFSPFCAFAASFSDKAAFQREVPRLIVEHNLHGIDIDPRAAQIAGVSLWLRAQRAWHAAGVKPVDRPRITRSNIVCAEPMPGDKVIVAEFVEQQFPEGERAAFGFLLETVFDRMTLAGEAGSLLKIEEDIRTAIAAAKKLWEKEPTATQRMLFAGGENATEVIQKTLDLSGITDEQFWEGAEERIYAALSDYAEQTETAGFQRRLFAEDAARGFAFIDVCRKRYDAVLMNPPFGQFSKLWKEEAAAAYPNSYNDILGAFVDSFLNRLYMGGRLGAITSRTCFFLTSFKDWREKVILTDAALATVADLGQGIMDNAMVEAAAYVMERKLPEAVIPFIRAIAEHDKQAVIDACVAAYSKGTGERRLLLARQDTFKKLADSPFVYWVHPEDLDTLAQRQHFDPEVGEVRVGLQTGDDPRFCRAVWEVAPQDTQFVYFPASGESFCRLDDPIVLAYYRRRNAGTQIWAFHVKAGTSQPWYSPITLKLNWGADGAELKNFTDTKGNLRSRPQNVAFYFRPGLSWTRRAVRFFPYIIPGSCIPSVSRYMAFPKQGREFEALGVCSSRVASAFMRFYGEKFEWPNFLVENLKTLPWPTLDTKLNTFFRELAVSEVRKRRTAYQNHEPFHEFLVPARVTDFSANGEALSFDATSLLGESGEAFVAQAYGLESDAACRIERDLVEAISFQQSRGMSDSGEDSDDGDSDFVLDFTDKAQAGALVSYFAGVAFGRWDIRYATGEQVAPELPDPFAPLPVCPPGQLQNAQGLPACSEDIPASYPVRIPWDGILVDDPNHPLDIDRRVREVIETIWTGREGESTAEALETDACAILGVKSFRDYFRKPGNFFADHLKRYSKSRRQAPIYWPLATKSGSYTLWIYYHRLNDQTLHKCLADFVDPKIKDGENELAKLTGKDSGRAADLLDFLNELKDLKDELERVIKLPWNPNLNDGVLITASPLWKLFRLPKWQKDLKTCWEELEKGEYDWAHLAYTIWRERVEKVCEKDRSIAIAHGLDHLCNVEPPKPKKPRGRKASS